MAIPRGRRFPAGHHVRSLFQHYEYAATHLALWPQVASSSTAAPPVIHVHGLRRILTTRFERRQERQELLDGYGSSDCHEQFRIHNGLVYLLAPALADRPDDWNWSTKTRRPWSSCPSPPASSRSIRCGTRSHGSGVRSDIAREPVSRCARAWAGVHTNRRLHRARRWIGAYLAHPTTRPRSRTGLHAAGVGAVGARRKSWPSEYIDMIRPKEIEKPMRPLTLVLTCLTVAWVCAYGGQRMRRHSK